MKWREYVQRRNRLQQDMEAFTAELEAEGLEIPKRRIPKRVRRRRPPEDDEPERQPGDEGITAPSIPEPVVPTPRNVDWEVAEHRASWRANRDSPDWQEGLDNPVHWIIKNHYQPGVPLVIGVRGKLTSGVKLAAHGSPYGNAVGFHQMSNGTYADLDVRFVGMDDEAELRGLTIGGEYGFVENVESHGMLWRCPSGAKSPIMDEMHSRQVSIIKSAFLPDPDHPNGYGGAGMMWGMALSNGVDRLYVADCYRAEQDGVPVRASEHFAYNKGGGLRVYVRNNLALGNRTGIQERAPGTHMRPHGPLLIEDNYAKSAGREFVGTSTDSAGGGGVITVWENPDYPTVIRNNRIEDARYKCLVLSHQPENQEPHLDRDGFAHRLNWIEGNTFTNERSKRNTVGISSSRRAVIASGNAMRAAEGRWEVTLDTKWAGDMGAKPNGCVEMHRDNDIPTIRAYQKTAGQYVDVDPARLARECPA